MKKIELFTLLDTNLIIIIEAKNGCTKDNQTNRASWKCIIILQILVTKLDKIFTSSS